jgi:DNA-binding MarR family transcriptional regulator
MEKRQPHHEEVSALRNHIVALARRLRHSASADSETWTALMAMGVIERAGGQATPTVVATELVLRSSNVAQLLNELDQRGLVTRTADSVDRRKVRLALTAEGLDMVQVTRLQRDRWLSAAMDECLSKEERSQLIAAGELIGRLSKSP